MEETRALMDEIKAGIIEALRLEGVTPDGIEDDAPLFGEGLGLDSIDALELVVMLEKKYGIQVQDMDQARAAFASVRALAGFVAENRKACAADA